MKTQKTTRTTKPKPPIPGPADAVDPVDQVEELAPLLGLLQVAVNVATPRLAWRAYALEAMRQGCEGENILVVADAMLLAETTRFGGNEEPRTKNQEQ